MAELHTGNYVTTVTIRDKHRSEGQGNSCSGVGERNSTSSTDLQWEERIRTFRDLVNSGKYPCTVKVQRGEIDKHIPRDPGKDGGGEVEGEGEAYILQVLELRRHKILVGDRLQWDRKSGEYIPTGKNVELPVTQKGWFEVLPENGQPVEYFDTINAIVNLRPKQFLVRTSTVGYQLSMDNGVSCWVPWEIRPGEVLTTGIVHMDHKKTKKKTFLKRIFKSNKAGKKEQELKYFQCFDNENREIMIPLIMTGVFSPVGDSVSPNVDAVYSLYDLVMAFTLPIQAQLIHTDSQNVSGVPTGMLRFETLKDHDCLLVANYPYVEGESKTFEVPVNDSIILVKEKKKKSNRKPSSSSTTTTTTTEQPDNKTENSVSDRVLTNGQIDLPIRVKDTKRSKGSAIFDKLSVRTKAKKERASLKALQEVGVFSSRLSRSDINYDEFFKADDSPETQQTDTLEVKDNQTVENESSSQVDPLYSNHVSKREADLANNYSVPYKRTPMQDRDLPPIPQKTRSPGHSGKRNKESIYEELPMAPVPPKPEFYIDEDNRGHNMHRETEEHLDDPDGYMTPAYLRQGLQEPPRNDYDDINRSVEYGVVVKRKPPAAPPRDALRFTRTRRVRSEYAPLPNNEGDTNFDEMFDFANNDQTENPYERQRPQTSYGGSIYKNVGVLDEALPDNRQRRYVYDDNRKFTDDSAIEQRPLSGYPKFRSRSQKNLQVEGNATIRSHNVRKMRTSMEVFNFSDSLRDLRQPPLGGDVRSPQEPTYGRVIDNERVKSYVFGDGSGASNAYVRQGYAESEPGFRKYYRSGSIGALSETLPKHGDDSAISMCSRGEYGGFPGESEFSYSEYSEWHDDGWTPPDDIDNLTVLEVSKSLRYIGMKDRVVIRFAHEQIDGDMLCSLDKKLLKEGFPDLNALEIKKILDFVGGWRPKK